MTAEPERFRAAVAAFLTDEATARVERWRGDPDAGTPDAVVSRHAFLGTQKAADVLGELVERGRVTNDGAGALGAHLRRFVRERRYASVRRTLRAVSVRTVGVAGHGLPLRQVITELWDARSEDARRARVEAVERAAASAAAVLRDRRQVAAEESAALRLPTIAGPDAGADGKAHAELAEAVLGGTSELLEEGLDWLMHRTRARPREAFDLLLALRAPDLDDAFPADGRYRRFGDLAAELGLHAELGRRVRVDASHGSADPRARLALVRPPFDVRIAPSSVELGAFSELAGAYATGRALAACLTHAELPVEARWPIEGTVGRAMGVLFAQWAFEQERLLRARRAPVAVLDQARRHAALVTVLSLRVAAACTLLDVRSSAEETAEAAHRAIGLPCSPAVASVVLNPAGGATARTRGELGGLALWSGLRDRFDVDWYRNPRARDVVRGAMERGAALSIEALEAELGAGPGTGLTRLREWFRGA